MKGAEGLPDPLEDQRMQLQPHLLQLPRQPQIIQEQFPSLLLVSANVTSGGSLKKWARQQLIEGELLFIQEHRVRDQDRWP